jgi:hypothetical protein
MTAALAIENSETMTPPADRVATLTDNQLLAALPTAVDCARRFVRFTLERWRLHSLIATAEVVVAELVANAIAATGIDIERLSYQNLNQARLNLVDVRLRLIGGRVRIEVWDSDPNLPEPRHADADVADRSPEALGFRVWSFHKPLTGGKVVRVELGIPPAGSLEDTEELALPRRDGFFDRPTPPALTAPIEVTNDPLVLQRVLDGLRRWNPGEPTSRPPSTDPDSRTEEH